MPTVLEAIGAAAGAASAAATTFLLRPTSARIQSSLGQATNQWDASFPGSAEYLNANPARLIDLEIGVLDAAGIPQAIRVIKSGTIDERRLEVVKNGVISHLKGRDAGAILLDSEFKTIYQRFRAPAIDSRTDTRSAGSPPPAAVPAGVTIKVGIFRARQVAEEIITSVGLTPAWQCRDYELWQDLDATGRRIDILKRLVEPWCSVEPSRVDVIIEGTTVYLRQRKAFPEAADFVLNYQAAAAAPHIRCLGVNVRKVQLPIYGALTLIGREQAGATGHSFDPGLGTNRPSSITSVIPFSDETAEDGGVTYTPGQAESRSSSRSCDPSGQLVARVEVTSTYQVPNQVLLRTVKNTYASAGAGERQVKREEKSIEYQPFTYDSKGPTNSPMAVREYASIWHYVEETLPDGGTLTVFKQDTEETTTYAYDEDNYLTTAATLRKVERDGVLTPASLLVKHYEDVGPQSYAILTDRYVYQQNDAGDWVPSLTQSDPTPASGHRPGGPNRPATKPVNRDMLGFCTIPIAKRPTLSTDPRAKEASAGGRDMSQADLDFIEAQHLEASGLWECELSLTVLSLPQIKRGSVIEIVGVKDQDGGSIPLGKALVYQLDMEYDEAGQSSTSEIRAVYYEAP